MSSIIPLAAISSDLAYYIFVGLAVVWVFLQIGFLVIAARRSALWLIGCLFLPFVGLFLIFIDSSARRNFLYQILVVIAALGVLFGALNDDQRKEMFSSGKVSESSEKTAENTSVESGATPTLAERQDRIRTWQKKLAAMKLALPPGDSPEKAAFDRELAEYLAELEKVKAATPPGT